jgi:hypothetical protein
MIRAGSHADRRETIRFGRWSVGVVLAATATAAMFAYWPSLDVGLVADDFQFTRRPWGLDIIGLLCSGWEHKLGRATAYRPFTVFTYGLNQWLWASPVGFHAVNIGIHAVASALAATLAWRLGLGTAGAATSGLLFALHPVHAESVSWISGRTAALSGALSLGAMCLVATGPGVAGSGSERSSRRDKVAGTGAVVLAGLAILSYEGAFLLPAMLLAVAWPVRSVEAGGHWRTIASILVPVAAIWLLYIGMRWFVISGLEQDSWALSSAVSREGFAAPVLQRAWDNSTLGLSRVLGTGWSLSPWRSRTFLVTTAATVACGALAMRHSVASRRVVVLALVIAVCAFAPYVTYTGFADRFAYLASIGLCLVLAAGSHALCERGRWGELACGALAAAVLVGLWGRQLLMSERDWQKAGTIAAAITRQVAAITPPPPVGSHVHVIGVPLNFRGAYVFITYFDLAISQALARTDLQISMNPDPSGACGERPKVAPSLCLRWYPDAQVLRKESPIH